MGANIFEYEKKIRLCRKSGNSVWHDPEHSEGRGGGGLQTGHPRPSLRSGSCHTGSFPTKPSAVEGDCIGGQIERTVNIGSVAQAEGTGVRNRGGVDRATEFIRSTGGDRYGRESGSGRTDDTRVTARSDR